MARVIRSASAKAAVLAIAEYIAADKPSAAERWVTKLDKTLGVIANYPSPGMRRHCFGNYLLFYVPIDDGIELRRVLHGARKIEDLY